MTRDRIDDAFSVRSKFYGIGVPLEKAVCLDLGCGKNASPVSSKVLEIPWKALVSVDAWTESMNVLWAKRAAGEIKAKDWVPYVEEMAGLVKRLPRGGYDAVLMIDSLEHLEKDVALEFLKDVEALNPRRIAIWLPLGTCPQDALGGNPYEVHKSTWTSGELFRLGFNVISYPNFHRQFSPPVDAAWAWKNVRPKKKGY